MKMMKAARLHQTGGPLVVDDVPVPELQPHDVLIQVKACNVVPNLANILANWPTWCPDLPLPRLPAIFGLDPAGIVVKVGDRAHGFREGDRVYVNPARSCGGCRQCRAGDIVNCRNFTFIGYFGFGPDSQMVFDDYPYGGLSEYVTAPPSALVRLNDKISFEQAARFGYIGTAYSAMRKMEVGAGTTILINGITGTLGVGAALIALALGTTRILGTARNAKLLERVRALSPERIEVFSVEGRGKLADWARGLTEGGVDVMVDTTGPHTPAQVMLDGLMAVRRGGKIVNIGGMMETLPLDMKWLMDEQIQVSGSVWFTSDEGQDMVDMVEAGTLDLSVFEHIRVPLKDVQTALQSLTEKTNGGFRNVVVIP
jgi:alcohol dehydrogenase